MKDVLSKEVWIKTVIIPTLFVYLIVGWIVKMVITFPENPRFEDDPLGVLLLSLFLLPLIILFPIGQYQKAVRQSDRDLEKEAVDAFISEHQGKETLTLSIRDIEHVLTESGQRDFWVTAFYLKRYEQLKNESEEE